jgi:hypothetical protein
MEPFAAVDRILSVLKVPAFRYCLRTVVLDDDLAAAFGVGRETLHRAFRLNRWRFPSDYAFVLRRIERIGLMLDQERLEGRLRGRRKVILFTEEAALLMSGCIETPEAVQLSIEWIRNFCALDALFRER